MWLSLFLGIIFLALTWYFFIFPLGKKRPVCLKRLGVTLYFAVALLFLVSFSGKYVAYAVITVLSVFVYYANLWLIYGIPEKQVVESLQKAGSVTRTSFEKEGSRYIMNYADLKIISVKKNLNIINIKTKSKSKKIKLFTKVFSKFIGNYFID